MALLFCDSFDHYPLNQILRKWSQLPEGNSAMSISPNGRHGTRCISATHRLYSHRSSLVRTVPARDTLIMGAAVRINEVGRFTNGQEILFGLRDSGALQLAVRVAGSGQLYLTRGTTTISGLS
ncbi:MAG: hypothetical protein C4321_10005, partial [Chloroflexota bacterium]